MLIWTWVDGMWTAHDRDFSACVFSGRRGWIAAWHTSVACGSSGLQPSEPSAKAIAIDAHARHMKLMAKLGTYEPPQRGLLSVT